MSWPLRQAQSLVGNGKFLAGLAKKIVIRSNITLNDEESRTEQFKNVISDY